jgi:hypothetical protein
VSPKRRGPLSQEPSFTSQKTRSYSKFMYCTLCEETQVNILFCYPVHEQSVCITNNIICVQMETITDLKNTKQNDFITFCAHIRNVSEVLAPFFCTHFTLIFLQSDENLRRSHSMPCISEVWNAFSDFPPTTSKPVETNSYCSMQENSPSVNYQNKQEHKNSGKTVLQMKTLIH